MVSGGSVAFVTNTSPLLGLFSLPQARLVFHLISFLFYIYLRAEELMLLNCGVGEDS